MNAFAHNLFFSQVQTGFKHEFLLIPVYRWRLSLQHTLVPVNRVLVGAKTLCATTRFDRVIARSMKSWMLVGVVRNLHKAL